MACPGISFLIANGIHEVINGIKKEYTQIAIEPSTKKGQIYNFYQRRHIDTCLPELAVFRTKNVKTLSEFKNIVKSSKFTIYFRHGININTSRCVYEWSIPFQMLVDLFGVDQYDSTTYVVPLGLKYFMEPIIVALLQDTHIEYEIEHTDDECEIDLMIRYTMMDSQDRYALTKEQDKYRTPEPNIQEIISCDINNREINDNKIKINLNDLIGLIKGFLLQGNIDSLTNIELITNKDKKLISYNKIMIDKYTKRISDTMLYIPFDPDHMDCLSKDIAAYNSAFNYARSIENSLQLTFKESESEIESNITGLYAININKIKYINRTYSPHICN